MPPGSTEYTTVGTSQTPDQVTGSGPVDLVHMQGIASSFEGWWDYQAYAILLTSLASFSRLILFDLRGRGGG